MLVDSVKCLTALSFIFAVTSCANLTHFNSKKELSGQSAVFVDAKQRGVYSVSKVDAKGNFIWKGVCAEPSPDAISALASALGLDINVADKGTLGVSNSLSEGVGTLGVRTAAIAALRDIMYRNCEAYALGGISDLGIETLQRRFQSTMVAILAIEQLTGAVRAPSLTVKSNASAGNAELIAKLTNETELALQAFKKASESELELKAAYEEKQKKQNATKETIDKNSEEISELRKKESPSDDEKKKISDADKLEEEHAQQQSDTEKAQKAYNDSKEITQLRKSSYDAINAARAKAITAGPSTEMTTSVENIPAREPLSDAAIAHLSNATVKIVDSTLNLNYGKELCTTLIGQNKDVQPDGKNALWACISLLLVPDSAEGNEKKMKLLEILNSETAKKSSLESQNKTKLKTEIMSYLEKNGFEKWRTLVEAAQLDSGVQTALVKLTTKEAISSKLTNEAATLDSNVISAIHSAMTNAEKEAN